jgi:hypothetical protein
MNFDRKSSRNIYWCYCGTPKTIFDGIPPSDQLPFSRIDNFWNPLLLGRKFPSGGGSWALKDWNWTSTSGQ